MQYDPRVFNVPDIRSAKNIILTPEKGRTTNERWEKETPHLTDLILKNMDIIEDSLVLDYGCGVGRLSKELIKRTNCRVVGVDISTNMRALAMSYVDSPRFMVCHPEMLPVLDSHFDFAIAVWVLQHVFDLKAELQRVHLALHSWGSLFVVNEGDNGGRVIPTTQGWINDGLDLKVEIVKQFDLRVEGKMDPGVVTQEVSDRTFWAVYG